MIIKIDTDEDLITLIDEVKYLLKVSTKTNLKQDFEKLIDVFIKDNHLNGDQHNFATKGEGIMIQDQLENTYISDRHLCKYCKKDFSFCAANIIVGNTYPDMPANADNVVKCDSFQMNVDSKERLHLYKEMLILDSIGEY